MDMNLTGRFMEADEAERCGLVSRVVPAKKLRDEAITAATKIAEKSMVAVAMVKEMVNRSMKCLLMKDYFLNAEAFIHYLPPKIKKRYGCISRKEKLNLEINRTYP